AADAPNFLAGFLVERHQEGLLLVVTLHKYALAIQRRRTAGPPTHHHGIRAQVLAPQELAREVVAEQSGHAEIGEDARAVGHWRLRGIGVGGLFRDRWFTLGSDALP